MTGLRGLALEPARLRRDVRRPSFPRSGAARPEPHPEPHPESPDDR